MCIISVIVPCYNQAQYLNECLNSVYIQNFNKWECIIVNDGSPDNTEMVAKEWVNKDQRFKYFYQKNGGVSSARNLGISKAVGKYILPLDADDKISPDYINLALEEFPKDQNLKVVYCKAFLFGSENREWDLGQYSISGLAEKNFIFCSAIFKKEEWESVKGYDSNLLYGYEDWEFWIAILKKGGSVRRLEKVGFYYRKKEISRYTQLDPHKRNLMLDYLSLKHADFFIKHLGSFHLLYKDRRNLNSLKRKLESKKFVLSLFVKRFFGIKI